jgi:hypothetical protein
MTSRENMTNTNKNTVTFPTTGGLLYELEKLGASHADVHFFHGRNGEAMPTTPTKYHYECLVRELRDPIYRGLGRKAAKRAFEGGFASWATELLS